MKTYQDIKNKHQEDYNSLIIKHKIFFAFSDKQLEEGKAKLNITDNKLITSLPMGMFALKTEVKEFINSIEKSDKLYKIELKNARQEKEKAILYELNNHECFYSGDISPVIDLFNDIYTRQDIIKVYKKLLKNSNSL